MSKVFKLLQAIHDDNVVLGDLYELSQHDLLLTNLALNISIYSLIKKMSMTIDDLIQKVKDQKTVEDSVVTLLTETNQKLKDAIAANDPAKLQELSDALDANTKELSDAVASNTPAVATT